MAAISSAHGDPTALTPPSSSHGNEASWGYPRERFDAADDENATAQYEKKSPMLQQNGNHAGSHSSFEAKARKMHSADNLHSSKWDKAVDNGVLSPALNVEAKIGRSTPTDWSYNRGSTDDLKRSATEQSENSVQGDDSKWIHRDKLAKIESEELQAAGIYIPRSRAPSKQRRDRSARRGTDGSENSQIRPRNDSALDPAEASPVWDLRTPEEIAEEQENAYFVSQGAKGGSRIPVAKVSPAPISPDYLGRATGARRVDDSPEGDHELISNPKTRSRSASATIRDSAPVTPGTGPRAGQRPATDASPKKTTAAARKTSASSKSSTTTGRPKTRSGPNKDSTGTRPQTRSGDSTSSNKHPEGDPPWLINSYKPDPRLPPDQQIIPTVARRLQQEKWEKEGKFGDMYDTEFRPLNDHSLLKPGAEVEDGAQDNTENPESSEWPLKADAAKSPNMRQGSSYSTMPKIADVPPKSPLPSPRAPTMAPQITGPPPREKVPQRVPAVADEEEKKGGCGCCVVM